MKQLPNIRSARSEDLISLCELVHQLAESVQSNQNLTAEKIKLVFTEMNNHPGFYLTLVAEMEGVVVGMISLVFYKVWFHPGGTALINELVIDRRLRGQGIGSLLIRAAVNEALARGMDEIEVGTEVENSGAQRFYRRCGFDETYVLLGMEFDENG